MTTQETTREMPVAVDAERQIFASILLHNENPNDCYLQAAAGLQVDDFSLDSHRRLFKAFETLNLENRPMDYTTLVDVLERRGEVLQCGGIGAVTDLINPGNYPRLKNLGSYIEIVARAAAQRNIINATENAKLQAYERNQPGDIIGHLNETLAAISEKEERRYCIPVAEIAQGLGEQLVRQHAEKREIIGLTTGHWRLDRAMCGLVNGENIVVAGDTGGGKTSFALNVAQRCCQNDVPVHIFSIEMKRSDLLMRMAAAQAGVPHIRIRNTSSLRQDELEKVLDCLVEIKRWPLWIDDRGRLSAREMYATGRMQAKRGAKLIVLDYLQKLDATGYTVRERVSNASEGVRLMAKDADVPVLNLSQLSRPEKAAQARKPGMHDLKESGNIEQDAHGVILLWREQKEDERGERKFTGNDAGIIGKNRNGPCMEIAMRYDPALMVWTEADYYTQPDLKAQASGA